MIADPAPHHCADEGPADQLSSIVGLAKSDHVVYPLPFLAPGEVAPQARDYRWNSNETHSILISDLITRLL